MLLLIDRREEQAKDADVAAKTCKIQVLKFLGFDKLVQRNKDGGQMRGKSNRPHVAALLAIAIGEAIGVLRGACDANVLVPQVTASCDFDQVK
jgi:hypothetical protein